MKQKDTKNTIEFIVMLANYCTWGLTWRIVDKPIDISLVKTDKNDF